MPERNHWKKALGTTAITLTAIGSVSAIFFFSGGNQETKPQKNPLIPEKPKSGESTPLPSQPLLLPESPEGWDCATINSPTADKYDTKLPTVKNPFRAAMEAGIPDVIEPAPYYFIPGQLGRAVREKFGRDPNPQTIQTLDEVNPVHNGDKICVKVKRESYLPGGVLYQANLHEQKLFFSKSINVQAKIRSKQGF